jgi:Domain of unknown function (DUF1841)
MFNPSRDEVRRFLIDAWRKTRANLPGTPLELLAGEIISLHPEYHALLESGDAALGREWPPELGETNPFLHLSMHLSIREQVSINQPRGVAEQHALLTRKLGSALDAEHEMMDCLGEMLWQAQRQGSAPDPAVYLSCLARKSGASPAA